MLDPLSCTLLITYSKASSILFLCKNVARHPCVSLTEASASTQVLCPAPGTPTVCYYSLSHILSPAQTWNILANETKKEGMWQKTSLISLKVNTAANVAG